MTTYTRIAPPEDGAELFPPCGGTWLRDEAGGLTPADAATAALAGLPAIEPEPAPAPE